MKIHCKSLIAIALAVTPAAAQPNVSQHPRVGQLGEVKFASGSVALPVGSEPVLGEVAAWAKENPEGMVVVEGYADRSGAPKANVAISTQRADSVVEHLLILGVPREQLVVAGFGGHRNGRRVVVWSTRGSYEAIEARLRARGAKTVQTSNLMARR